VREHPFYTFQILNRVPVFREFAEDASDHHERLDGKGYYRGVGGDRLTMAARTLAVADVIDALSSDRPYRKALAPSEVVAMLRRDRGTAFCGDVVDAAQAAMA
jgi:HD-GYP domain-containing protein (c-di-GMP phosphodiesterase class II)